MPTDEIQRIQNDLTTIRQAITKDKPYDRADIFSSVVLGVGALMAIPMLQFLSPRICVLLGVAPGMALWFARYLQTRKQQQVRPNLWAEYKWGLVAVAVITPAIIGWMWWSQQFGASRMAVGSFALFCIGIAGCLIGFIDSNRRTYLLGGIITLGFGILMPTLGPNQIPIVGLIFVAMVGLGNAAMVWWITQGGLEDASPREIAK